MSITVSYYYDVIAKKTKKKKTFVENTANVTAKAKKKYDDFPVTARVFTKYGAKFDVFR